MDRIEIGARAEDRALVWLEAQGLRLVARNVRYRCGEIDLIMRDRGAVVFVEVRYRRRTEFGTPAETVGREKQRRLRMAAALWLAQTGSGSRAPCRFDIVAIVGTRGSGQMSWLRDAF